MPAFAGMTALFRLAGISFRTWMPAFADMTALFLLAEISFRTWMPAFAGMTTLFLLVGISFRSCHASMLLAGIQALIFKAIDGFGRAPFFTAGA